MSTPKACVKLAYALLSCISLKKLNGRACFINIISDTGTAVNLMKQICACFTYLTIGIKPNMLKKASQRLTQRLTLIE